MRVIFGLRGLGFWVQGLRLRAKAFTVFGSGPKGFSGTGLKTRLGIQSTMLLGVCVFLGVFRNSLKRIE